MSSGRQTSDNNTALIDRQLEQLEYNYTHDNGKGDPKLYVDVNIGKQGGMERIVVYEGDSAESLAAEFCKKHGLTEEMQEKLFLLLEQQIVGVLPKIVEGGEDEQEEEEDHGPDDYDAPDPDYEPSKSERSTPGDKEDLPEELLQGEVSNSDLQDVPNLDLVSPPQHHESPDEQLESSPTKNEDDLPNELSPEDKTDQ